MRSAPPLARAFLGGLVATLLITAFLYWATPFVLGGPMDVVSALAAVLGTTWGVALAVHFVDGTFLFPTLYAWLVYPAVPAAPWLRGTAFGVLVWIGAEAFFAPIAGAGFFHAATGSAAPAVLSLIGHLIYGAALGAVAGSPVERAGTQHQAELESRRAGRAPSQRAAAPPHRG